MPIWFIVQLVKPPGLVVLVWHTSHATLVVICVPTGLPFTTVVPTVAPVWQLAQLVVMPVWFIVHAVKVVVLEWQVSHAADVEIWLTGLVTIVAPWNACPPWQLAQPDVMPVWLIVQLGAAKPPVLVLEGE